MVQLSKKSYHFLLYILATVLCFTTGFSYAQTAKGTVKGKVLTADGKPADNISITLKATPYGTITNEDGDFSIKAPEGNYTLMASSVGKEKKQIDVTITSGKTVTIPSFAINGSSATLGEISISTAKINRFKRKKSVDVAKMPLNNLENPQSYTTIGQEVLTEQAIYTVDDAVKNAAGITKLWNATSRAGDGGAYYTLRGFPVQSTLRNGLSGNVSTTIDDANLEKIEIIRGPSGTLYGSSLVSYGGLINRVTKKPFDTAAGEVSYTFGSYNYNRASIDYNTPLDSGKKALLRINSAYNTANTFQDNGFSHNFAFDPSFTYKINDRMTLNLEAEINQGKSSIAPIFYFGSTIADLGATNANQLNIDYKRAYQSNDLATSSTNVNFFGQLEYKISDQWKSSTNISSTNSDGSGPGPYFYLLAGNNSIQRNVWNVAGHQNTLQVQQNFNGDFKIGSMRNRLVAGLDFLNQSQSIRYQDPNSGSDLFDVINLKGPIPGYNNFNKNRVDSLFQNLPSTNSYSRNNTYTYSAYVSDVLNITDNLLAMASLRVDHFVTKPINDPTTDLTTTSFNQTTLSPKFGLVYQVIKNKVSLFGNYMNGFSNPGYYLTYDATSNSNVSKLFKSEQANQWEGGVKVDIFDGKLSGTISYYDISVKNKIRADAQHANANVQDGTQYSKGVEVELIANPLPGFNIIAGYAHNNSLMAKSGDYDNGRRPQTAGPPNSANFWASYTITKGDVRGLGIGFGGNYASNNYIINNSYNGKFFLPEYTVFNTGVFYNKEKYRFGLNVNNLTNKEYFVGYTTVSPQMLRQILASVAFRF